MTGCRRISFTTHIIEREIVITVVYEITFVRCGRQVLYVYGKPCQADSNPLTIRSLFREFFFFGLTRIFRNIGFRGNISFILKNFFLFGRQFELFVICRLYHDTFRYQYRHVESMFIFHNCNLPILKPFYHPSPYCVEETDCIAYCQFSHLLFCYTLQS